MGSDGFSMMTDADVANIVCGYAFADLCLYPRYDRDLVLMDIEEGNDRHVGFGDAHPGYTFLARS